MSKKRYLRARETVSVRRRQSKLIFDLENAHYTNKVILKLRPFFMERIKCDEVVKRCIYWSETCFSEKYWGDGVKIKRERGSERGRGRKAKQDRSDF